MSVVDRQEKIACKSNGYFPVNTFTFRQILDKIGFESKERKGFLQQKEYERVE